MDRGNALKRAGEHWNENADTCHQRGVLMQSFSQRSQSSVKRCTWQERADAQFARAKAFRQLALDAAAELASNDDEASERESLAMRLFKPAKAAFTTAEDDLLECISIFETEAQETTDPVMSGRLHRAIEGMRKNPDWFYFTNLNALDLITPATVMNAQDGMSGLDWAEEFRPQVWEVQRVLNRRRNALSALKDAYGRLNREEQVTHADVFLS